jgi:hypothetical protein
MTVPSITDIPTSTPEVTVTPYAWDVTAGGVHAGTVYRRHEGVHAVGGIGYSEHFATLDEAVAGLVARLSDPDPDRQMVAKMAVTLGSERAARKALVAYRKAL